MREQETPTLRHLHIPIVLVVAGTERLLAAVSQAAVSAQVLVAECSTLDAATTAAQMLPLVMVLTRDVYEHDKKGFDELARDVRARLLVLGEHEIDTFPFEHQLDALMLEAENERPSWVEDGGL